jgi:hypothetical protein
MAKVESWFDRWAARHVERHPHPDWPPPDSEFWGTFKQVFIKHGVSEDVADEASRALAEDPPAHLSGHLSALLKAVRAAWDARRRAQQGGAPDDRREAELASRNCDDCGGVGVTHRWRRKSVGGVDSEGRPLLPYILLYCRCPMGRWVEQRHREDSPEIRRRLYDLDDHPWLWGEEYRDPPAPAEVEAAVAARAAAAPF